MPNWAFGFLEITGTKDSVLSFTNRIYCSDEQGNTDPEKFQGCFIDYSRNELAEKIEAFFCTTEYSHSSTFILDVSFAWSAEGCLIPAHDDIFISLAGACMADGVDVEVRSVAYTEGFEEHILGKHDGSVQLEFKDLHPFCCPACGVERLLASFENPRDAECCECGHIGLNMLKEEIHKGEK